MTGVQTCALPICKRKAKVHLKGGTLEIDWQEGGRLFMTGPAEEICRGTVSRALIEGVL